MNLIRMIILHFEIGLMVLLRRDCNDLKIKKYRLKGYNIGANCRIFTKLGGSEPYLVNIGNNVTISNNVVLLTHDNSIIKASKKEFTDLFGCINIGSNCFIGANSIILPGVSLADGTIIAAGSVVTKSVGIQNKVIAGNPAKIIGDINEFYEKNKMHGFNCSNISLRERRSLIMHNKNKLIEKKQLEN